MHTARGCLHSVRGIAISEMYASASAVVASENDDNQEAVISQTGGMFLHQALSMHMVV
jgi:hypothetical protein